jgi:ADP-heptose:LPS heptosyltransferase
LYNSTEKKAKSTVRVRGTLFKLLGKSHSKSILSLVLKRRQHESLVNFPINVSHVKNIVIILPEDRLQSLYQLKNVISLVSTFKHAAITLLCEQSIASVVNMIPGLSIIEYDIEDRIGFGSSFLNLSRQFRGSADICFLLDHQPELAVLYFAGATRAPIRIGYHDSGEYPFLNLHVRPSAYKKYLPDWNCSIAQMFSNESENLKWCVAKKTIEEVEHLMKESGMKKGPNLGGIDVVSLLNTLGESCTSKLLSSIISLTTFKWYLYLNEGMTTPSWIQQFNIPILSDLSVSRAAALVTESELIITGNSMLYGLATLLDSSAIGFFNENEIERYCPQSPTLKGIVIKAGATDSMIMECISIIKNRFSADN